MKIRRASVAIAFSFLACVGRGSPDAPPVPEVVTSVEPAPLAVVDLCVHPSGDPVCVLRNDGRVACAHLDDPEFAPPLAGISGVVELRCGEHSICARDAAGMITCLATSGELQRIDGAPPARSLARDCAVGDDGQLYCWDENFEVRPRVLPPIVNRDSPRYAADVDLQLVDLIDNRRGCALERSGALWCWSGLGSLAIDIGEVEGLSGLRFEYGRACFWRGGVKLCTNGKSAPEPRDECEGTREPCTCRFSSKAFASRCSPPIEGETLDPTWTLHEVARSDGPCLLDAHGRVFCQAWPHVPDHELTLAPTTETTARFEPVERVPPPPDPEPLPDPAQSKCPMATAISNRVCERLTEPGGPLECKPGNRTCPRRCAIAHAYYSHCSPTGFNAIAAAYGYREAGNYLIYVDGSRVWLGPRLPVYMNILDIGDATDTSDGPVLIELHDSRHDGHTYYDAEHELSAVVICARLGNRPACSRPIAQTWTYKYIEWDEDTGRRIRHETADYQAKLTVSGTNLKVAVRKRKNVDTDIYYMEDTQVLQSGTYSLESVLDRRFEYLPE